MSEKNKDEINQYLTFILDNETYAFNVLKIKEVLELPKITKMPKTPQFMSGVINLRGGVVPVVDLRLKFDMPLVDHTVDSSIIIVETNYEDEVILIGALVDAVRAVIKISNEDIELPPKVGMNLDVRLIEAIGKSNNNFVIILDIDKLFSSKELAFAKEAIEEKQKKKKDGKKNKETDEDG